MRLAVFSAMTGSPWGASETLWSAAAEKLLADGYAVSVATVWRPRTPPRLRELERRGARLVRWGGPLGVARARLERALAPHGAAAAPGVAPAALDAWLGEPPPELALVSLGSHLDPLAAAARCRERRVPYALLVHAASPRRWPPDAEAGSRAELYRAARAVFFVSHDTRRIVERQLGGALPRAEIATNPLAVRPPAPLPWPPETTGDPPGTWRLACVGRLGCWQKGQDLVLDVLGRPAWRERPVRVDVWGEDHGNLGQLRALVRMRGLAERVRFRGHTREPERIWRHAHALLLPSRYEGVPLVTAEAMACGRVPVVTAVGRNPEWVEDGATGFLAPAATADLVDAALERAWRQRPDWPRIGRAAAARIAERYEARPVERFARRLVELAGSEPGPAEPA